MLHMCYNLFNVDLSGFHAVFRVGDRSNSCGKPIMGVASQFKLRAGSSDN